MQYGMPTLLENASIAESAALCQQLQLDFVELNMSLPYCQLPQLNPDALQQLAEEHQLFFTIHLDENLNISDYNPYVASAYCQTVLDTIALGKQLHVPTLNMHLPRGVYVTLPDKKVFLFDMYRTAYLDSIRHFRDQCTSAIGDAPMRICIENTNGFLPFQQEALALFLESPVFGLTYDIGHDAACGGLDTSYLLAHRNRLHHMHMHDALGKSNHLALGAGELPIAHYHQLAKEQSCRVVLETKTIEGLTQSVQYLRQHILCGENKQ